MFAESAWSRKTIGDVDVVYHEGLYHLFHLVLPNHDFIAHAISDNALNWRRVDNALFVGEPGSWDDLMLWTVHVSRDPHQPERWRMFYTGLSRRDHGRKQRIGLAVSDDLYHWCKAPVHWEDHRGKADPPLVKAARAKLKRDISSRTKAPFDSDSCFPLEPDPNFYEASIDGDRGWISFRDPFYFYDDGQGWLLAAARTNEGPLVRRGCVAAMEEVSPSQFEALPPLHAPRLYDDIEVPNLFRIDGEYYLIGSLREDAKIRYWHTEKIGQPWRNYYDNVLLPQGNYAGRICQDDKGILLWNFYTQSREDRVSDNLMPPPKRLCRSANGLLRATTFEGFDQWVSDPIETRCVHALKAGRKEEFCHTNSHSLHLVSEAGFQAFVFEQPLDSLRIHAHLVLTGPGKCGLVFRIDPQSHDGYYLSLDLMKGVAQLRAWGTGPLHSGERMMQYRSLQAGYWYSKNRNEARLQLLSFGSYHELTIDDTVILSLADATFESGLAGFYVETANLQIRDLTAHRLHSPTQSDEHLTSG